MAIEEQFYLVWPLIVLGVLSLARRRGQSGARRPLTALLAVSLLGAIASAVDSAVQLQGGRGLDRVYYGTDTRAAGLLIGASLAVGLALLGTADRRSHPAAPSKRRQWLCTATSVLALGIIVAVMHAGNGGSLWLYPYGLFGVDLAVVTLIAAIVLLPQSLAASFFALAPIRQVGMISYGIYLWHFPLFLWLDASSTGVGGAALLVLRLGVTLLVSIASFFLIEQPIRRRRVPSWLVRPLAPLAMAGTVAALLTAGSVESTAALGLAAVPAQAKTSAWLRGSAHPCSVGLKDTKNYGLSPLSPAQAAQDEPAWLVGHQLKWHNSSRLTFTTCPPKRVLVIGDSLAFTLGVGLMENEQAYGVEVADAAILGCVFNNQGQLDSRGKWEAQYAGCPTALQTWAQDARALRAQGVVIELGYRDEFNWKINGRMVHIGQPAYDTYVRQRITDYVQVLGRGGTPILFLTVPWSSPPALPDGSPAPAASPARHSSINQALVSTAANYPGQVRVLNIDKLISPGGYYDARVNGKLCRFDGVHFTVYCSRLLQPDVLQRSARCCTADRARKGGWVRGRGLSFIG